MHTHCSIIGRSHTIMIRRTLVFDGMKGETREHKLLLCIFVLFLFYNEPDSMVLKGLNIDVIDRQSLLPRCLRCFVLW